MKLKELIDFLAGLPPTAVVRHGFGEPESYRGNYSDLAFEPKTDARIGDMLAHARSALGATFTGYKGGDFLMCEWTECYIAEYGCTVEYPIHPLEMRAWAEEATGFDHRPADDGVPDSARPEETP